MSCNGGICGVFAHRLTQRLQLLERQVVSMVSDSTPSNRPLPAIRVRAAAGNPRRGWLTAAGLTVPVALGRGGIKADKREGDGGTPRGTFQPRQVWWRADRHPRPKT